MMMPDKKCRVCYECDQPFTVIKRRHHCRMCGQIFCNTCSSFYIDGMLFDTLGVVRGCRLCYNQLLENSNTGMDLTGPGITPWSAFNSMIHHIYGITHLHTV
jgi:1-phosphatidylinositol-3-phosphate 5-kinase